MLWIASLSLFLIPLQLGECRPPLSPRQTTPSLHERVGLDEASQDNTLAKVYGVAMKNANQFGNIPIPTGFPEWISAKGTQYVNKDKGDWTAGFFPGTLWLLYQRATTLKQTQKVNSTKLKYLAEAWTVNLESNKGRTDTHDLGFMMHDTFGWKAKLTNDAQARDVVIESAKSLARRFNPTVGAIRSWGSLTDNNNFNVIIDNMMNLDMLYWASQQTSNKTLADIATTHALTTIKNHFRADGSTYHVLNYNPRTGALLSRGTNQGYSDSSTWSRGQAWAIHGYIATYKHTKDVRFLDIALKAVNYFLSKLPADGVPYWDFNAPLPGPRDTSAGMIVASGLLQLYALDRARFVKEKDAAVKLIEDTLKLSSPPRSDFGVVNGQWVVKKLGYEGLLMNGTIDNNPGKTKTERSANTGLVYAGYYLVEAQNWILQLGL
ncbi:Six-hairpin glycosidase [Ascobolus immersus RN42]|uniref:Six-hairpin glycosidase n=1 Tax=Ascobolus immersus RN42 TaxID=1160509 RepID=A0A3N4ISF6_ASCIM|nr:Six-hairpin glycosidase [Ascobolus immersus RN42]